MSLEFPQELQDLLKMLGSATARAGKLWRNLPDIQVKPSPESEEKVSLSDVMQELFNRVAIAVDMSSQYAKMISENHKTLQDYLEQQAGQIESYGNRKWSDIEIGRAQGFREVARIIQNGSYLTLEDDAPVEEESTDGPV